MPSLPLSDATPKENKKKDKKNKTKKSSKLGTDLSPPHSHEDGVSGNNKKAKRKRKASDFEVMGTQHGGEKDKSETSSELFEPKQEKKKKKAKLEEPLLMEEEEVEEEEKTKKEEEEEEDPNAVSRFRISEPLREKLKEKGIESLFPIQAMTFDTILDGSDLVGRARTGQVYTN